MARRDHTLVAYFHPTNDTGWGLQLSPFMLYMRTSGYESPREMVRALATAVLEQVDDPSMDEVFAPLERWWELNVEPAWVKGARMLEEDDQLRGERREDDRG